MSMDAWEILRSLAATLSALSFPLALAAFVFSRRDRSSDAMKAALSRIETTLSSRIESERRVGDVRHAENTQRLGAIESHSAALDEAIKHVPTQHHFRMLQTEIGLVATSVAKLEGSVEAMTRMAERMNQYLMERGT